MDGDIARRRSYLFLQGMATDFMARLGRALMMRGHGVHRVNFNGGDRLFWRLAGAVDYRGDLAGWPRFLARILTEWRITDIILFGDCRPLHCAAIKLVALRGLPVHVFEEGYLRPNWVTLEHGGVNGNSSLPRDPEWFRTNARSLPPWDGGQPVRNSYFRRAIEDILYTAGTILLAWRYPGYRTHRPWHPLAEYASGARRFLRQPIAKRRRAQTLIQITEGNGPYYVFPLQLDSDSQIRYHSQYAGMTSAIRHVIGSFARCAPADSLLVITEHPLDNGISNWQRLCRHHAVQAGVEGRVVYLEGGSPETLLERSHGVVTVNSTVGFLALNFGRPVVALGYAVYDMPDLTFQGGLDDFWLWGMPPDVTTFDAFRRVIAAQTQLNGGYFCKAGITAAVAGAVARLESYRPNCIEILAAGTEIDLRENLDRLPAPAAGV
jgi:capsular polysaccharide export protein